MKKLILYGCIILLLGSFAEKQKPVSIIFDTDIAPDYDDVGAMALLHAFADKGEAKILATISCNAFETTVPTLSVLNTYFNRPNIPVAVTKSKLPNKDCSQQWAQAIVSKYSHTVKSNDEAEDAVKLYRKILASQPDKSVTIVTVGFFTNLANLLNSTADEYSNQSGKALLKQKVKHLISMAARIGDDDKSGYEFNVLVDAEASKKVFSEWPTPWIMSGFEIGEKILTGIRLINNDSIQKSPVKDAFRIALTKDNNTVGRNSWDQTAVLVAVRGMQPWFDSRKLNFEIEADGKNILIPGDKITYLTFKEKPEAIAKVIEDLMMHQPAKDK
jgi:inosine-uridine nucleoside N-ribohydrolase